MMSVQGYSRYSKCFLATLSAVICATAPAILLAQAPAPPPAPPAAEKKPAATEAEPAEKEAAAEEKPAAAEEKPAEPEIDPVKEREIIDMIVAGKQAVGKLDLATAQLQFEQAFAKCDEYEVKGPLLARVYLALGSLFTGYLQQIPQGTEFMKMALAIDPSAAPEAELVNDTIETTFDMVRERLGITGPAKVEGGAGAGAGAELAPGAFWIMKHDRITRAKRMHPIGIYIESNPMVAIQGVRLYFRLPSDRHYQAADMQRKDAMYGLLIGCDAIALLDPQAIYYYIEVIGGDGSIIAHEGTSDSPIEVKMLSGEEFVGDQPNLPGMPEHAKCNPEDAAPCPPWDPHCHDMPCVTSEDCLGSQVCREGYCVEGAGGGAAEEDEEIGAIGLYLSAGLGIGAGVVLGYEEPFVEDREDIELQPGLSPTWMFLRVNAGYFILDYLTVGAWVRFQHIHDEGMKIAGLQLTDYLGPMWGLDAQWFFWGNDRFNGGGQVLDERGNLAERQGFRAYARLEVNFYGAMYHSVTVSGTDEEGSDVEEQRNHASGMQGLGLGAGVLYGLHKYIDIGGELIYDYQGIGVETTVHNFDLYFKLQGHF